MYPHSLFQGLGSYWTQVVSEQWYLHGWKWQTLSLVFNSSGIRCWWTVPVVSKEANSSTCFLKNYFWSGHRKIKVKPTASFQKKVQWAQRLPHSKKGSNLPLSKQVLAPLLFRNTSVLLFRRKIWQFPISYRSGWEHGTMYFSYVQLSSQLF